MSISLVCLCGSTRFLAQFDEANRELSRRGLSVVTISMCLPRGPDGGEEDGALKELLDLVHLNKILRSDAVFVVGDGYIGRSTAREILWADMHGKPIIVQREDQSWDQMAHQVRCGSWITSIVPHAKNVLGLPL